MLLAADGEPAALFAIRDPLRSGSVEALQRLHRQGYQLVMMTGDNPLTANAIAMGGGSDIAIETAAMTLMRHSLHGVADALELSKATLRNMKQNLFGAFIYNTLGIPIAAGVLYPLIGTLLSPVVAGAAMALSSITIVSNANRLLRFKPKGEPFQGEK